ncbi:MAG TPA: YbhB/YbcL family Raf kinase inhibitor-like protein [Methanomicrobiales archaeon]|nr:YbhB/YbcL family Raf kinase inhibitor-like protein [Methanomicrobiales archaeon]
MRTFRLVQRARDDLAQVSRQLGLVILLILSGCLVPAGKGGGPALNVSSGAFPRDGQVPVAYTCDGANISPPLSWGGVPEGTASIAVVVTDPDAAGRPFVHWAAYNIPPGTREIPAGAPGRRALPAGSLEGTNDFGKTGYAGPCPPPGKPHHYHFTVSALDMTIAPGGRQDGRTLVQAMAGHILAQGEIVGTYQRG